MDTLEAVNLVVETESAFRKLQADVKLLRKEPVAKRIERLKKLRKWIHANRASIHEAMHNDFRKPALEVDGVEIFHVLNEIQHATNNLDNWTAPKKIDAPFTMLGTRSWVYYEPRGVCLIISPWNYPFSLAVGPLVAALSAGNAVLIKPSELTPHVSALLKRMCNEVFEQSNVIVVEGDAQIASALLKLPFDHIFFTGSPAVGKIIMKAAAEHLTSVTLELGGKSPTIVTASANLTDAAKRIAVSKFINNGQTCIAPDYLLVDEKVTEKLLPKLINEVKSMFSNNGDFETSSSYCRIVNEKHFNRLNTVLQDALDRGAKLEFGGKVEAQSRFFHPMILSNLSIESRLLDEEIFGPILPVVTYRTLDEAIELINSKPKPLALYVYTTKAGDRKRVLAETSAGAVCINESAIHFLHSNLPFGGVNNSGLGKSHGYYGFLAFSNEKPVLRQKSGRTMIQLFYPPYTRISKIIMDWFLKLF
ncbi:MAG TPA: aldehyde dehydrogenase family protein [Chryseosolibacter sp.]|nr:aldehyde dehydrogenase family protein [Chryseosolibacter sp.]